MKNDLENKTAIITGSALGIGKEAALLLAKRGTRVIVSDINETEGNKTVSQIISDGGKAKFVKCDVTKEEEIISLIEQSKEENGRLDIMVNNAVQTVELRVNTY